MKRLLLAPLLLAISGCSSDIVIKTDLGEKYIAKNSAVTVVPNGKDELLDEIWKGVDKLNASFKNSYFQRCMTSTEYKFSEAYCKDTEMANRMGKADRAIANSEEEKIHWFNIRFRPVFVDLNNNKNALGYEQIACINPNLNITTLKAWDKYAGIEKYQPKKITLLAYELMKSEVCRKYAKFE